MYSLAVTVRTSLCMTTTGCWWDSSRSTQAKLQSKFPTQPTLQWYLVSWRTYARQLKSTLLTIQETVAIWKKPTQTDCECEQLMSFLCTSLAILLIKLHCLFWLLELSFLKSPSSNPTHEFHLFRDLVFLLSIFVLFLKLTKLNLQKWLCVTFVLKLMTEYHVLVICNILHVLSVSISGRSDGQS